MKKLFIFLSIAFLIDSVNTVAQTLVPGGLVNGTWAIGGSPYNVQGNIQISNDSTLIIEPGVSDHFLLKA